jgi:probable HAF family extracellular repeat protein
VSATGINDVGQIVGVGIRDGQPRAFLLNPR